jgi:hypothetical protein
MITGQYGISIGDVGCSIQFEDNFFQDTFGLYLSDYREWGFCKDNLPRITITVKEGAVPQPTELNGHIFYHSMEYDTVAATMLFDTATFKGELGFSILRGSDLTIVRITELIESFVCNAYIFYFSLNMMGTFIHASGIDDGNQGYIFTGPSGYGKSTIAKLSFPRTILCDEMILLKKDKVGGTRVFGTPFVGESQGVNHSVRCKGIYFIEQSGENALIPISRMSGAVTLMKEGIMGNFLSLKRVHNILTYSKYFSLLLDVLEGIPCYSLRFKKDNSFWRLINGNEDYAG